jgi:CheY-like chemotaxis protein
MNLTPSGLRVLVIEDEAVIAMTAEDMIEQLGHEIAGQAATLDEALEQVGRCDFDVALLDINLNGTMSTPVAHALRNAGKAFIITTGYGNSGPQGEFAGVMVVAKPYTIATLEHAILNAVNGPARDRLN